MSSQRWNRMPELVGKDLKKAKGEEGAGSKSFMEASTDSSLHRVLPLWAAPQSVGLMNDWKPLQANLGLSVWSHFFFSRNQSRKINQGSTEPEFKILTESGTRLCTGAEHTLKPLHSSWSPLSHSHLSCGFC